MSDLLIELVVDGNRRFVKERTKCSGKNACTSKSEAIAKANRSELV
jgi:hypothetical protein